MRLDMKGIMNVDTPLAQTSTNPSMQCRMTSVFRKKLFFVNVRINLKRSLSELCFKKRCSIQELMEIVLRLIDSLALWWLMTDITEFDFSHYEYCLARLLRLSVFLESKHFWAVLPSYSFKHHPGIILGVQKWRKKSYYQFEFLNHSYIGFRTIL